MNLKTLLMLVLLVVAGCGGDTKSMSGSRQYAAATPGKPQRKDGDYPDRSAEVRQVASVDDVQSLTEEIVPSFQAQGFSSADARAAVMESILDFASSGAIQAAYPPRLADDQRMAIRLDSEQRGKLVLETTPDDATTEVDGHGCGATNVTVWARPGERTVVFSKPGYKSATTRPTVAPRKITSVKMQLVPDAP